METLASALVLTGVAILAVAVWLILRLIRELPRGSMRLEWVLLLGMVACFIAGYLGYQAFFPGRHVSAVDMIVPGVFFMGAGFVALVAFLMLRTTRDLGRISVLETENVTDVLTGLQNRRDFDRHWNEELKRARRFGLPLALLVIDVDLFKGINDTYGQAVGDQVLVRVGKAIRAALRETDFAARYGGEEFAVVAPRTRPDAAVALAERIRAGVEGDARYALGASAKERNVTVSVGIAGCENSAQSSERLFERADEALYAAKRAGRNRVVVAAAAAGAV